jgi:uncharacterized OB-fold protein
MISMDNALSMKSSRTLRLTYNLPINRTLKFWEGLKKGKVYATKCKNCRKLQFPPVADCGNCGSTEVEWIALEGEGRIITFTQVFVKPASFSEEAAYIVAIAQLNEGIKVLAWLTGVKREEVKVGMKVKLKTKLKSNENWVYEFVAI